MKIQDVKETFPNTFILSTLSSNLPPRDATTIMTAEKRLGLIHRVLVPDQDYPKEYAIPITDARSIFIRQEKTRSSFVLRGEMRFGTALVTDTKPKTLLEYEQASLGSLASDTRNISVPHEAVISLALKGEEQKFRK